MLRIGQNGASEPDRCGLQYAAGRLEPCAEAACRFWEEGGAVLPGGCALTRLALDLDRHPGLVHALVELQRASQAAPHGRDEDARSLYHRVAEPRSAPRP